MKMMIVKEMVKFLKRQHVIDKRFDKQFDDYLCNTRWSAMGRFLGFPECCILDFCSRKGVPKKARKLSGSGFIPCLECSNTYSEIELIDHINKNRTFSEPFPTPYLVQENGVFVVCDISNFKRGKPKVKLERDQN